MKKYLFFLSLILAFIGNNSFAENKARTGFDSVTIMATSSLAEVMSELVKIYSGQNNLTLASSFDSPEELGRRIADGENVDVFISEHPRWMNDLKQKGMIDVYSISNLVANSLVVICATDNYLAKKYYSKKAKFHELMKNIGSRAILIIADPENDPLGIYTKEAIEAAGIRWEKIQQMSQRASNSSEALFLISSASSVGITYASDAIMNNEVQIISEIPVDKENPIIYQAAVVAGDNMEEARRFLDFLKTSDAMKIFEKHGFKPLES